MQKETSITAAGQLPGTGPAQTKRSKHYQAQDKEIAELITAARQLIARFVSSEDIAEKMAKNGYNAERLEEGRALCDHLQDCYTGRQVLMGNRMQLSAELKKKDNELCKHFSDFRVFARVLFKDPDDRRKLGVTGRRSRDRQRVLTTITSAVAAALEEPFRETFSRHGYGSEQLAALLEEVEALRTLDNKQDLAEILAKEATGIRDEAASELRQWVSGFRSIAKRVLRDNPDWGSIVDL
ncbi:MAG: hypothetical protein JXA25_01595 [Anaerolineales bacterium]|nr:hypothetical protein [Anaerolineales bacterium]